MVPFFLGGWFTIRHKWLFGIFLGFAVIVVLTGFLLYHRQAESRLPESVQGNSSALDLGIVYLPVTPQIASYYGLGVDSGALITQVAKGSLVDQAGIKDGDVITNFNGVQIGEADPLLGMLRSCLTGHEINLVVWRHGNTRAVTIVHSGQ